MAEHQPRAKCHVQDFATFCLKWSFCCVSPAHACIWPWAQSLVIPNHFVLPLSISWGSRLKWKQLEFRAFAEGKPVRRRWEGPLPPVRSTHHWHARTHTHAHTHPLKHPDFVDLSTLFNTLAQRPFAQQAFDRGQQGRIEHTMAKEHINSKAEGTEPSAYNEGSETIRVWTRQCHALFCWSATLRRNAPPKFRHDRHAWKETHVCAQAHTHTHTQPRGRVSFLNHGPKYSVSNFLGVRWYFWDRIGQNYWNLCSKNPHMGWELGINTREANVSTPTSSQRLLDYNLHSSQQLICASTKVSITADSGEF